MDLKVILSQNAESKNEQEEQDAAAVLVSVWRGAWETVTHSSVPSDCFQ